MIRLTMGVLLTTAAFAQIKPLDFKLRVHPTTLQVANSKRPFGDFLHPTRPSHVVTLTTPIKPENLCGHIRLKSAPPGINPSMVAPLARSKDPMAKAPGMSSCQAEEK